MRMKAFFATVLGLVVAGCGQLGKVDQGRVIQFEAQSGVVTLIRDSNYSDPSHPKYDVLPPVTVRIPTDPSAMGPAPQAGQLVRLDMASKVAVVFDSSRQKLEAIRFTVLETSGNVLNTDDRVTNGNLPQVDSGQRAVTLYSPQTKEIVKISVPAEFSSLPAAAWKSGDEVRYYYKQPGQAIRMMNVTRTKVL